MNTSVGEQLASNSVLIIVVGVVTMSIYLICLLMVIIRRARKLIELRNRRYYLWILFYIASKLILCAILLIELVVGFADDWSKVSPQDVELMTKSGIVLTDLTVIELFLVGLENYFTLCLSSLKDRLSRRESRMITMGLRGLQATVAILLIVPMILLDCNKLGYNVVNGIGLGLNLITVLLFLATFFFLNFKMTGVMLQTRLNQVIKRVLKLQLIILVSRAFMTAFQLLILIFVPDSFESKIDEIALKIQKDALLALLFIASVVMTLFTQGLPIMYSLRSSVVQALNFQTSIPGKGSIFTGNTSALERPLIDPHQQQSEVNKRISKLSDFSHLKDLGDRQNSIWLAKRGQLYGVDYLIRISKHQISSYIFQDIQNELALWEQLNISTLSRLSYFCEGDIIHLVERYYEIGLDQVVDKAYTEADTLKIAIKVGQAIGQFHEQQLVHGCLSPGHIFLSGQQVILNGCGLHSMRKYLSLITGYTNKTIYTSVEHLKDKNNVILKPSKAADVYSYGVILYEIITKNRQYRQLPLKQVIAKFADQNFRPKLPEQVRPEVKNIIRRCWHETIARRPEIQEVLDLLRRLS